MHYNDYDDEEATYKLALSNEVYDERLGDRKVFIARDEGVTRYTELIDGRSVFEYRFPESKEGDSDY